MDPRSLVHALSRTVTSVRYLVVALVVPLVLYLLYPLTGLSADEVERAVEGSSWSGYFLVAMATLGAIAAAVGIGAGRLAPAASAPPQRPGGRPSLGDAGMRMITAVLLALPPLAVVGATAFLADGVTLPVGRWLELGGELMLGAVPFAAIGLLLATVVAAVDVLDIVLLATVVVLAILGGLFQPPSTFPSDVTAVAHVLPSFRLADLGWAAIAGGRPSLPDAAVLLSYTVATSALFAWRWRAGSERSDA